MSKKVNFPSYEEAKNAVCGKVFSSRDYSKGRKLGELPDGLPAHPDEIYKNQGWVDWSTFLGTNWLPYEIAQQAVFGLAKTYTEYLKHRKSGELPKDLPSNPQYVYSSKKYGEKWQGFDKFFQVDLFTYEEARDEISGQAFCEREYLELFISGSLHRRFPRNPRRKYKGKGWEGFEKFLQTEWPTYEEAQKAIFGLVRTAKQYRRCRKLPFGLPSDPSVVYSSEKYGKKWEGWNKFLQTDNLQKKQTEDSVVEKVETVKKKPIAKEPFVENKNDWEKEHILQESEDEDDEKKEDATHEIAMYFCRNFKQQGYSEVLASIKENYVLTKVARETVKKFFADRKNFSQS